MATARVGRRPGAPDTRGEILAAARQEFERVGFDAATVRRIAGRAGVDPALVHHYFGTKEKLFLSTMDVPFDPDQIAGQIVGSSAENVGERAVRTFLTIWDDPVRRGPLLALLRSAMTNDDAAALLRQFVSRAIVRRVMAAFGEAADSRLRAEGMIGQLLGMAFLRYIVKLEPLASASRDEVIALIGPVLQKYVDDAGRAG